MFERNADWRNKYGLDGAAYRWDLSKGLLIFDRGSDQVLGRICLVGTTSKSAGTFLWSWGNTSIPAIHSEALASVREFGEKHCLGLLTSPEVRGGRPEAIECMCIAGRIQRAIGTFSDQVGDLGLYFTIVQFEVVGSG